ncbi:MAG: hypothetical protein M1840_003842 [Geoglossum simile]|nr:MAG: hypothetical protein M1840_003842 [Geoglossum simile]
MLSKSDKRNTRIDFSKIKGSLPESIADGHPPGMNNVTVALSAPKSHTITKRKAESLRRDHDARPSKRVLTSSGGGVDATTGLRDLTIPKAVEAGVRSREYIATKRESPWKSFEEKYELKLDGFVTIATRKAQPRGIVIIKRFTGPDAANKMQMLQKIRHDSFLHALECFSFENHLHVVFEHVPTTLAQIAVSPVYLTERELAAIIGQILHGLEYLASNGFEHGSLKCCTVLINAKGQIKITGQECCKSSSGTSSRDVKALGYITMALMQKYCKNDGPIGVENLDRWPSDSNAVDFLSMTTSTTSIKELLKHPLLKCAWEEEDLGWIVELTVISVNRGFKYPQ